MAGFGTGYPNFFECSKARRIYYGNRSSRGDEVTRTSRERAAHVVTLTGRQRPTKPGKGHPRKSWTTFEYRCSCGHVGWSSHIELERRASWVTEEQP
jgi:hypothetical protein